MLSAINLSDLPSYQHGLLQGKLEGRQEGRQEGIQKGRQEGRQEGIQAGKLEIARTMLASGFEVKIVSECTGLSVAIVEKLQTSKHS